MTNASFGVLLIVLILGVVLWGVDRIDQYRGRAARKAVKQRDYYHSAAAQRLRAIHDGAKS